MNIALTFDVERDWYRVLGTSTDHYKEKGFKMLEYAMPRLIEISEEYSIPYTLFICGEVAQNVPHLFEGLEKNHSVGVHTHPFTHDDIFKGDKPNDHDDDLLRLYSYEEQKEMILRDKIAINDHLGCKSFIFRAGKHGANETTFKVLKDLNFKIDATINLGYQFVGWKPYLMEDYGLIEIPTYCDASPEIINSVKRLLDWSNKFDWFANSYSLIFHPMVFGNPLVDRDKLISRYETWIKHTVNQGYNMQSIEEIARTHTRKSQNNFGMLLRMFMKPLRAYTIKKGDSMARNWESNE